MITLKEDGSLDIEAINNLPIIEYTKMVKKFTSKQREIITLIYHLIIVLNIPRE